MGVEEADCSCTRHRGSDNTMPMGRIAPEKMLKLDKQRNDLGIVHREVEVNSSSFLDPARQEQTRLNVLL